MSTFAETEAQRTKLLSLLNTVWKTCPTLRSDAARYYAVELAEASGRGLVTAWDGKAWGTSWRITPKGLTMLTTHQKKGA